MRVEKTVFISYRRTNVFHARAIHQWLTAHGYDAFLDYENIDSGAFDRIILGQIDARAHFLIILTPSALERCGDPSDWLRREIERAIDMQRNIIPLMLEGFDFGKMDQYLTGKLVVLPNYNGLEVPGSYFEEAMTRLDTRFLSKPLSAILHPTPPEDRAEVAQRQAQAAVVPAPTGEQLMAEQHYERGNTHYDQGDYVRAIADYDEALRLNPQYRPVRVPERLSTPSPSGRTLTLVLRRGENANRDRSRIQRLYGYLIQYPGSDRFRFILEGGGKRSCLAFPNSPIEINDDALDYVTRLLGAENVVIEE